MADVKWIKLNTNIFDDDKMCILETCEEGIAFELIWIKLLCLAGKCNQDGRLMLSNGMPYSTDAIAKIFRFDIKLVKDAFEMFQEFGMLEFQNRTYVISNWLLHQNGKGLEEMREKANARQKKWRDKQKSISNATDNVINNVTNNVTGSSSISESKKKKDLSNKYYENESLNNAFVEYIKMRKTIKKPATENAIKLAMSKLDKLAKTDEEKIAILNQSTFNSWQGLFELKDYKKGAEKNGHNKTDARRTNEDAANYWV